MVSTAAKLGIAATLVLVFVMVYYASKAQGGGDGSCTGTTACPDKWYQTIGPDSGDEIPAYVMCGDDGKVVPGGIGPGKCQNPCPADQTPCWDDAAKIGRCMPGVGIVCPCGPGSCGNGKCDTTGKCVCDPGWAGPACDVKQSACDATAPSPCGPRGKCVGGYCVCDDGWVDNIPAKLPCSMCAPGRGPAPGSAYDPKTYCTAVQYPNAPGRTVLVPPRLGTPGPSGGPPRPCYSGVDFSNICVMFGPNAAPAAQVITGPNPGNAPNDFCESCPNMGGAESSAPGCMGNNGIWASPSFNPATYKWWDGGADCTLKYPAGFVGMY